MAVTQRLELRQTQTLVMTPQLQQAIKLLQLSNLELAAYIEKELEQNPLLEHDDGDGWDAGEDIRTNQADSPTVDPLPTGPDHPDATADTLDRASSDTLPAAADDPLDADYADLYDADMTDGTGSVLSGLDGRAREARFGDDEITFEQWLSDPVTLREHLLNQLQMDITDPVDRLIGVHLIDLLDEAGYLTGDLSEVAQLMGCELARVEATLAKLQGFEPPGVFARNLRECLALQLADRNRLDPAMHALLDNLNLLGSRDFARLRRLCGVDEEDFAAMVAEIKALNPKPATTFEGDVAEPVVPDILMRRHSKGGWLVELNSETLPRVLINKLYFARIQSQVRSKADKAFVVESLQSANWLVKALHQRATTILKVATELVRLQEGFFEKGVRHMRPLTLRDVAESIGMHESTVSRVTSNKYIATPRGVYELKYFFTAAIAGADGGTHSAAAVRHRIKELIDAEPCNNVLSDDKIVDILRAENIDIARRTVAKYREAMRIPTSARRRRDKALRA